MHYVVDLDTKSLKIKNYRQDTIKEDMAFFRVDTIMELQTNDRRIFHTVAAATKFIRQYKRAMRQLKRIRGRERMPAMLLKRRWLPLTAMGLKPYTERHYNKPWMPGQPFRLYDQTYCVDVILVSIEEIDGSYRYNYKVA